MGSELCDPIYRQTVYKTARWFFDFLANENIEIITGAFMNIIQVLK